MVVGYIIYSGLYSGISSKRSSLYRVAILAQAQVSSHHLVIDSDVLPAMSAQAQAIGYAAAPHQLLQPEYHTAGYAAPTYAPTT